MIVCRYHGIGGLIQLVSYCSLFNWVKLKLLYISNPMPSQISEVQICYNIQVQIIKLW